MKWDIPDDKRISSIRVLSSDVRFTPATLIFQGKVINDEETIRSFSSRQITFSTFLQGLEEDGERLTRKIVYTRNTITIELCSDWEPEYYLQIQKKFEEIFSN